jgi:hypothetical protein
MDYNRWQNRYKLVRRLYHNGDPWASNPTADIVYLIRIKLRRVRRGRHLLRTLMRLIGRLDPMYPRLHRPVPATALPYVERVTVGLSTTLR